MSFTVDELRHHVFRRAQEVRIRSARLEGLGQGLYEGSTRLGGLHPFTLREQRFQLGERLEVLGAARRALRVNQRG